jgi:hypothetical protein
MGSSTAHSERPASEGALTPAEDHLEQRSARRLLPRGAPSGNAGRRRPHGEEVGEEAPEGAAERGGCRSPRPRRARALEIRCRGASASAAWGRGLSTSRRARFPVGRERPPSEIGRSAVEVGADQIQGRAVARADRGVRGMEKERRAAPKRSGVMAHRATTDRPPWACSRSTPHVACEIETPKARPEGKDPPAPRGSCRSGRPDLEGDRFARRIVRAPGSSSSPARPGPLFGGQAAASRGAAALGAQIVPPPVSTGEVVHDPRSKGALPARHERGGAAAHPVRSMRSGPRGRRGVGHWRSARWCSWPPSKRLSAQRRAGDASSRAPMSVAAGIARSRAAAPFRLRRAAARNPVLRHDRAADQRAASDVIAARRAWRQASPVASPRAARAGGGLRRTRDEEGRWRFNIEVEARKSLRTCRCAAARSQPGGAYARVVKPAPVAHRWGRTNVKSAASTRSSNDFVAAPDAATRDGRGGQDAWRWRPRGLPLTEAAASQNSRCPSAWPRRSRDREVHHDQGRRSRAPISHRGRLRAPP